MPSRHLRGASRRQSASVARIPEGARSRAQGQFGLRLRAPNHSMPPTTAAATSHAMPPIIMAGPSNIPAKPVPPTLGRSEGFILWVTIAMTRQVANGAAASRTDTTTPAIRFHRVPRTLETARAVAHHRLPLLLSDRVLAQVERPGNPHPVWGFSLSRASGSESGEPIMNSPAGDQYHFHRYAIAATTWASSPAPAYSAADEPSPTWKRIASCSAGAGSKRFR